MWEAFNEFMRITDGIAMSDIFSWLFAAAGGIIVYKAIDHIQTSMERHSMLKDIETTFSSIYNSVIAKAGNEEGVDNLQSVMVRSVLHDDGEWIAEFEDLGAGQRRFINDKHIEEHQLYVQIRKGKGMAPACTYHNEWISTQALHEIMLHCRRIEKMFKDGIIKRIDLSDMFREIVPLAKGGRLQFFAGYYNRYDADCVGYLVMQTIVSCEKYKNEATVKSFVKYYHEHPEIQPYFLESRRIRPVMDILAVRKFREICDKYK